MSIAAKTLILARAAALCAAVALSACSAAKHSTQPQENQKLSPKVEASLKAMGMKPGSPIMMRIFKEEGVLEVWKQKDDGKYGLAASYEICKWSGKLGPKYVEGDRQAPEGFYTVRPSQMNPNSQYHLSFDLGFPNVYDRVNGRFGRYLMVHGGCSSAGCYSMTDDQIEEIYAFARDAFKGGQRSFQVQALPFRMTDENMARYRSDPNIAFWKNLKEGYDYFEANKVPPVVGVCEKRYAFNAGTNLDPTGPCPPSVQNAYAESKAPITFPVLAALSEGPAPSIKGIEEAALVATWSRRRAKGEPVTAFPPDLSAASREEIDQAMQAVRARKKQYAQTYTRPSQPRQVATTAGGKRRF